MHGSKIRDFAKSQYRQIQTNRILKYYQTKTIVKTSYFKRAGLNPEVDQQLLYLLGKDFRTELAGTQWNYEDEQVITEVQEVETTVKSEYQEQLERLKRGSREASDYYMIDMTKNPNNLVPSGYLE